MDMDPELAREWITAANKLDATLKSFPHRRATDGQATVAAQTGIVSVQVSDPMIPRLMMVAVFSAALCAVLSVVTLLGGGMLYLNMKDHLDAIYMMAPQLNAKPEGHKSP